MKLITRKKIILWGVISLVFFAFSSAIFIIVNNKKKSASISQKKELSLSQLKRESVAKLEKLLSNKSIKEDSLLTKMKDQQLLKADETDWKNCFNSADSLDKLKETEEKVLSIANNLPQNPSPNSPQPEPTPNTPPTDKWEKILWEVRKFFETNPSSLHEIKEWVKKQNYPDPLEGVDLKGDMSSQLKNIPDRGPVPGMNETTDPRALRYKDYVQLSAVGNGNCFVNSFSVLLTGKANDISLAMPLKVKLCLEYMTTEGFAEGSYINTPKTIKNKIVGSGGFGLPGAWLENADIIYMCEILKRPIAIVSVSPQSIAEVTGSKLEGYEYPRDFDGLVPLAYSEPWVIYNSGNHFQPLIKK